MQLKRYTDFSLRVLIYLALHDGRRVTISEISGRFRISRNHLMKVVNGLAGTGFIDTYKGKNGGMCLARPAAEITVGAVVRASEGTREVVQCHSPPCPIVPVCLLRPVLDEAMEGFLGVLDRHTIADLTREPAPLLRLVG